MIKKVFNFLFEVLGMPYHFVINLFKGGFFAVNKAAKGFWISIKFTAKQIGKFIKSIPGMLIILGKWFIDAIKESIAQIFTILGFFIAWFTLTGSAQDIVGIAIIVSIAIWLLTIYMRD